MTDARTELGDSHNFGRRVSRRDGRIAKPRSVFWEWLVLSADSPLRRCLDGLAPGVFGFLPSLEFLHPESRDEGEVESVTLAPLPMTRGDDRRALAQITGRAVALWSWLGVSDLHWENLVLGVASDGRVVFAPLDVEMILADLSLPTETKLLPDADPEYADVCRHAAGVRRVLPYLGKPIAGGDLVAMAAAYLDTLALLDRHAETIAEVFATLPGLRETPIRICLRGTGDYVRARSVPTWPPLLDGESEQMARGDIPYFFRLYGRPGIHYYGDESLRVVKTLPSHGDVPQLDPVLPVARGMRSASRKKLREEGMLTLLGAFDDASIGGLHASDGLAVTFRKRTLLVKLPRGEELESRRDMRAFVGSVYLPCRCGEVLSVFVPPVTRCGG